MCKKKCVGLCHVHNSVHLRHTKRTLYSASSRNRKHICRHTNNRGSINRRRRGGGVGGEGRTRMGWCGHKRSVRSKHLIRGIAQHHWLFVAARRIQVCVCGTQWRNGHYFMHSPSRRRHSLNTIRCIETHWIWEPPWSNGWFCGLVTGKRLQWHPFIADYSKRPQSVSRWRAFELKAWYKRETEQSWLLCFIFLRFEEEIEAIIK